VLTYLNIDIDVFFQNDGDNYYRFLTNHYIHKLCTKIKQIINRIDVVTIALSPEYCGGWGAAFDVLHILSNDFNFSLPFKYKKIREQHILEDINY